MSDAVLTPEAQAAGYIVEHRVILEDVSWETYERLLAENDPGRGKRFTYDNGVLQIAVLSRRHEWPNRVLASFVETVAVALDLPIEPAGSTTFKRKDLKRGFEPDTCYYIQNAEAVVGLDDIDLKRDPPPDLVIEIDITRPSLPKLPIFAAVGVREVWRYNGDRVHIHVLDQGAYQSVERSSVFPVLTSDAITGFLRARKATSMKKWRAMIEEWVEANR